MSNREYAIKKDPNLTYVSKAISTKGGDIRYISKIFDLRDFKDFYTEQKNKKVYEVIRESSTQEITAILKKKQKDFLYVFKDFQKRLECRTISLSVFMLDLTSKTNLKFMDKNTDELIV